MTLWNVKLLAELCVWFLFWPCLIICVATFGPVAMFVGGGTPCYWCCSVFCVTNTNNFWFSGHMGNNLLCSDQALTVLQIAAVSVRHKQDKWEDCDQRAVVSWDLVTLGTWSPPVDAVQIGVSWYFVAWPAHDSVVTGDSDKNSEHVHARSSTRYPW